MKLLEFNLPLPPTLNATYRYGKGNYYKTKEARNWELEALQKLKFIYKTGKNPFTKNCYVGIMMYLKRDRDIDSTIKVVLDILAKAGVYQNDSQITFLNVQKFVNPKATKVQQLLFINVEEI